MQAPRDNALHPVGYVMEQIAAVPGMVADVRQMEQATNAARAFMIQHEVAPPHELPINPPMRRRVKPMTQSARFWLDYQLCCRYEMRFGVRPK